MRLSRAYARSSCSGPDGSDASNLFVSRQVVSIDEEVRAADAGDAIGKATGMRIPPGSRGDALSHVAGWLPAWLGLYTLIVHPVPCPYRALSARSRASERPGLAGTVPVPCAFWVKARCEWAPRAAIMPLPCAFRHFTLVSAEVCGAGAVERPGATS